MKQRKCPQAKAKMCWDYGDCEDCVWNKLISRYERKINRLKAAVNSVVESFTRMETLYKIKCTELECAEEKVRKETAKEVFEAVRPLLIMKNKKYGDDPMMVAANEWFNKKVKEIFEPFGVEVGE